MKRITERQVQILIFIEKYIQENNYSPTVREIAEHFRISAKGAHDHILSLKKKGCLSNSTGKSRTLRVITKTHGGEQWQDQSGMM